MAVDPSGADLQHYLAEDRGGPVTVLNLLRYKPGGGRERHLKYVEHFRREAAPSGAEVLCVGDGSSAPVAEPGQSWDDVVRVRYRSRQAFRDMVRDPAYGTGTHLRTESFERAVLQAPSAWEL